LDRAAQKAFDRRVDYEMGLVFRGYRRSREIAEMLGLSHSQFKVYIRCGAIKSLKDPWRRIWVRLVDYVEFKKAWVRGVGLT